MSSYNFQAPSKVSQYSPEGKWSTGFNDCCLDRDHSQQKACCLYTFLPTGWKAMYAAGYRRRLREMFKLPQEPHNDCLVHECCCVCGLTQEYRELKNRGADPSLGWQGNVEKWNREGLREPPIPTRMARC